MSRFRKYHSVLILLGFILLFCNSSRAQAVRYPNVRKKLAELYEQASTARNFGDFKSAETYLRQAVAEEPAFADAWWFLGSLYLDQFNDDVRALDCCREVARLDAAQFPLVYFNMSQSFLSLGMYDSVGFYAKKFRDLPATSAAYRDRANLLLANAAFAEKAMQRPVDFKPVNPGAAINSEAEEFFPAVTADGRFLYFTRRSGIGRSADENIWVAENKNGIWQAAMPLGPSVNTPNAQEGAHSISPSGKYLFFTRCGGPNGCDIYFSRKNGNGWDPARNIGNRINTPGWESQPCIAADGVTLFFSSTRRGGQGGADLWMSVLDSASVWSEPVNLGPAINTSGDEMRPFIHPDNNTLYFSSTGHPGMGGADLFVSRRGVFGEWREPLNLGYPINTSGEERGIYLDASGSRAYLASGRAGQTLGGEDIFSFTLPDSLRPVKVSWVKGIITDKQSGSPLSALIRMTDLKNGKPAGSISSDEKTGEYLLTLTPGRDYAFIASRDGYLLHSEHFSLSSSSRNEPFKLDIRMAPIRTGDVVTLNNIFFETNQHTLKGESQTELKQLQQLLEKNPGLKIKLRGHTDNTGKPEWNKQLSENRAKAVYEWLINRGIEASRISYEGMGATQPVADNNTESGKAKNRRTEMVVTAQ